MKQNDKRTFTYIHNIVCRNVERAMRIIDAKENPLQAVSDVTGIPKDLIVGQNRKREIVLARHIYFYVSKKFNPLKTWCEIGVSCGNRDHATVIHGYRNIDNATQLQDDVSIQVQEYLSKLL